MKKILISLITFLSLLAVSQAELKNHHKEITSKDREKIALTLIKAIKGAGYDPIMLYQLENEKKLKSTSLEG